MRDCKEQSGRISYTAALIIVAVLLFLILLQLRRGPALTRYFAAPHGEVQH